MEFSTISSNSAIKLDVGISEKVEKNLNRDDFESKSTEHILVCKNNLIKWIDQLVEA